MITLPGKSLLFQNGEALSVRLVVTDRNELLLIAPDNQQVPLPLQQVTIENVGQYRDRLQLSWQSGQDEMKLFINQVAELSAVLPRGSAFDALRAEIGQALHHEKKSRHWLRWLIVALIVGVGLFIAALKLSVPLLIDHMPTEWDERIGDVALESFLLDQTVLDAPDRLATSELIVNNLSQQIDSQYEYELFLIEDLRVNAMAFPGGKIILTSGFLQSIESDDQLASVLGHEMAHVEARHGLHQLIQTLGWRVGISLIAADASLLTLLLDMSGGLANLSYSRQHELSADKQSLDLMMAEGRDPMALAQFLKKQDNHFDFAEVFKTHPNNHTRIDAINAYINQKIVNKEPHDVNHTTYLR